MAIDREALIKIKIALTGGEAGTAIDKIVTRMEALEKRLGLIGSASASSPLPQSFQQPAQATQTVIHISPIPLPTRITNFADMRSQAPSSASYEKVPGAAAYQQQRSPTDAAAAQQQPWPGSTSLSPTPPAPAPAPAPWPQPAGTSSGGAGQTPVPVTVTNFPGGGQGGAQSSGAGGGFWGQLRTMLGSVLHLQHGGIVPGHGHGDVVPAMLEPGEGVLSRSMMAHFDKGGIPKRYREMLETMYEQQGEFTSKIGRQGLPAFMQQVEKRVGTLRLAHDQPAAAVPGSSLDIPRTLMPQIAKEHLPGFMEYLKDQSVDSTMGLTAVRDLKPSQNEIGLEKIAKNSMKSRKKLGKKVLIVSSDGYIVDGHHGWAGMMIKDHDMEAQTMTINLPFKELLEKTRAYDKAGYKAVGQNEISYENAQAHFAGMAQGGIFDSLPKFPLGQGRQPGPEHEAGAALGNPIEAWAKKRYGKAWPIYAAFGQAATWGASAATIPMFGLPLPPGTGIGTSILTGETVRLAKRMLGMHLAVGGEIPHYATGGASAKLWKMLKGTGSMASAVWNDKGGIEAQIGEQVMAHGGDALVGAYANFSKKIRGKSKNIGGKWNQFMDWIDRGPTYDDVENKIGKGVGELAWHGKDMLGDLFQRFNPFGKHFDVGGRADMTRGGTVPTMSGVTPGSDWHPAWLTDDEHVVNARSARKHRRLLEAINADHFAVGGTVGPPMTQTVREQHYQRSVGAQMVHVVNFADMGGAGGGGGGLESGLTKEAVASFVVEKGLQAFNATLSHSTAVMEINQDAFLTGAQKQRAIEDELIPFASKLHALADAIDGVNVRIQKSNAATEKTIVGQDAQAKIISQTAALQHQNITYQSAAYGMSSQRIATGQAFNPMTYRGDIQTREQDIRLAAEDALVNAQRQSAGASQAFSMQGGRAGVWAANFNRSNAQADRLQMEARAAQERENRSGPGSTGANIARGGGYLGAALTGAGVGGGIGSVFAGVGAVPGALIGGGIGLAGYAAYDAFGPSNQRNRAGRTEADNAEFVARNQAGHHYTQMLQEQQQLAQRAIELQQRQNDESRAAIGLRQAELQILQMRSARMAEDVSGLGGMGRGQYRQAQRALQLVQGRGQEGFERLAPELIAQAQRAAGGREIVGNMQRILGQQRAQAAGRAGLGGEQFQADWQGGAASLGDTVARERALAQTIRQELDAVAVRSANNLAAVFTGTMDSLVTMIQRQLSMAMANWEQRFRQTQNNR